MMSKMTNICKVTNRTAFGCGILFSLLSVGCKKELDVLDFSDLWKLPEVDENGVIISRDPIWEVNITKKGRMFTNVVPIFHEKMVIVPAELVEDTGMLMALDVTTGEEVWRWNDDIEGYNFREFSSREQFNRKDNIVIYNSNNRFCAVNLDNGTTLWKDQREGRSNSNSLQVIEDHYYYPFETAADEEGVFVHTLMRGSIHSPDHEQLIDIPMDNIQLWVNSYGSFYAPHVYVENGNTKAFLAFSENLDVHKSQGLFGYISYDITAQTYDFEKVRLPDTAALPIVARPVMIREMMVISAGYFMYGVNKHTGELVWTRRTFAGRPSYGRFTTAAYKDRLFAGNRIEGLTLELDPFTGATKWIDTDTDNRGSTDPMLFFLNDVLYFIGTNGRLYAYDINSGKMLWKLKNSVFRRDSFISMQVHNGTAPDEEDMLVACSWKNAYRFAPAR